MNITSILYRSNPISIAYGLLVKVKKHIFKGGNLPMNENEEKKLYEMLDLIEKQDETLRKLTGEEQYVDKSKGDRVIIRTNDKKAMKFWEE